MCEYRQYVHSHGWNVQPHSTHWRNELDTHTTHCNITSRARYTAIAPCVNAYPYPTPRPTLTLDTELHHPISHHNLRPTTWLQRKRDPPASHACDARARLTRPTTTGPHTITMIKNATNRVLFSLGLNPLHRLGRFLAFPPQDCFTIAAAWTQLQTTTRRHCEYVDPYRSRHAFKNFILVWWRPCWNHLRMTQIRRNSVLPLADNLLRWRKQRASRCTRLVKTSSGS
jgi:hypothetical protein